MLDGVDRRSTTPRPYDTNASRPCPPSPSRALVSASSRWVAAAWRSRSVTGGRAYCVVARLKGDGEVVAIERLLGIRRGKQVKCLLEEIHGSLDVGDPIGPGVLLLLVAREAVGGKHRQLPRRVFHRVFLHGYRIAFRGRTHNTACALAWLAPDGQLEPRPVTDTRASAPSGIPGQSSRLRQARCPGADSGI